MPVVFGAVMPSSAVLVPEVGRGRERPAVRSIAAGRRAGRMLIDRQVETLVLLLPAPDAYPALWLPADGDTFRRPFDDLDAPELVRHDQFDRDLSDLLVLAGENRWELHTSPSLPPSAMTPLYFLSGNAQRPVLAIGVPERDLDATDQLGRQLATTFANFPRRTGVVAAGTLSTKVFLGAPGGYHPASAAFDAAVVDALTALDRAALLATDLGQRIDAGEHLVPQLIALLAIAPHLALDDSPVYDAPFGEGYLTVIWTTPIIE